MRLGIRILGFFGILAAASSAEVSAVRPSLLNFSPLSPSTIGEGTAITLTGQVSFPKATKLTATGPSHLTLYEKQNSGWTKIGERQISEFKAQLLTFEENFAVGSSESELSYDVVVYYCSEKFSVCSLHSYRGDLRREKINPKKFDLKITLPALAVAEFPEKKQ